MLSSDYRETNEKRANTNRARYYQSQSLNSRLFEKDKLFLYDTESFMFHFF